jgi:hypothetical protein
VTGRQVADSVKAVLKGVLNTWTEGRLEDTQVDLSKCQVQRETTERGREPLSRSIDLAQYKDDGSIEPRLLKQNRTHTEITKKSVASPPIGGKWRHCEPQHDPAHF